LLPPAMLASLPCPCRLCAVCVCVARGRGAVAFVEVASGSGRAIALPGCFFSRSRDGTDLPPAVNKVGRPCSVVLLVCRVVNRCRAVGMILAVLEIDRFALGHGYQLLHPWLSCRCVCMPHSIRWWGTCTVTTRKCMQ
jgi:hypothetical protein